MVVENGSDGQSIVLATVELTTKIQPTNMSVILVWLNLC